MPAPRAVRARKPPAGAAARDSATPVAVGGDRGSEADDELPVAALRDRIAEALPAMGLAGVGEDAAEEAARCVRDEADGRAATAARLSRHARRQRRRQAMMASALRLSRYEVAGGEVRGGRGDEFEALRAGFGDEAAAAARVPQQLPVDPPGPEPETVAAATAMPQALAAWRAERARQQAAPFVAGAWGTRAFAWRDPPPRPPEGTVWRWGSFATGADDPALGELMAKEVRNGAIEVCEWSDVDVVTPVFVARHPVTGKPRLVHDLRALCARMRDSSVDYDRAIDALLAGARYCVKFDVLSAFRHISLSEDDRRRMAFVCGGRVWRWKVLPFGASQSPELFCDALDVVIRQLRADGVHLVVYVDDLLLLARTPEELDAAVPRVFQALREAGWYISLDKTFVSVPAEVMPFLGLLVDLRVSTEDGPCLRVSVAKARKLSALCDALLTDGGGKRKRRVITLRELQRVGGTLAFLSAASPHANFMRQGINAATGEALGLPGRTVALRGLLREELRYWASAALTLPGLPAVRPGRECTAVATDAAGLPAAGWGAVVWRGDERIPPVSEWLHGRVPHFADRAVAVFGSLQVAAGHASAALELAALRRAIQWLARWRPDWIQGRRVFWYCDATAAVAIVRRWRSRAPGVAGEAHKLLQLCHALRVTVHPHWVRRSLGWQPVADFMSRLAWREATAEWSVPRAVYGAAVRWAGWTPTLDLFATAENAQVAVFASQWPTAAGQLGNAFGRSWDGIAAWAFPPFSQLRHLWRQLQAARGARLLVVMPETEPVPGFVQVAGTLRLGNVSLIDCRGRTAPHPCPRRLMVVDARSPE